MADERIRLELGACGLDCSRCVARRDGEVQRLAKALQTALIGFETRVEGFSRFAPALKQYGGFLEVLEYLTNGTCGGCRSGECLAPGCAAKDCHRENQVDFCFQCEEFPCDRNAFSEALRVTWQRNNEAMRAEGIQAFYEASKSKPRY